MRTFLINFMFIVYSMAQSLPRNRPEVEKNIMYLDSYLPAAMQVIAHLTELLKYEIRPPKPGESFTSTTTIRPTPPHKPGYYQPERPPGPDAYWQSLVNRLDNFMAQRSGKARVNEHNNLYLLGQSVTDLIQQINQIDDSMTGNDIDTARSFSDIYDDTNVLAKLSDSYLKQTGKRVPPTRAYVTLLSLYDSLSKEAKSLNLNKYHGYTPQILAALAETSSGSAGNQLHFVLSHLIEKRNTQKPDILKKVKMLVEDLDQTESYISEALRYLPPLQFIV